jgi:hypothetical protein
MAIQTTRCVFERAVLTYRRYWRRRQDSRRSYIVLRPPKRRKLEATRISVIYWGFFYAAVHRKRGQKLQDAIVYVKRAFGS